MMLDDKDIPAGTPAGGTAVEPIPSVEDGKMGVELELSEPPLSPLAEPAKRGRGRPKGTKKRKPLSERAKRERKRKQEEAAKLLSDEIARIADADVAAASKSEPAPADSSAPAARTMAAPAVEPSALTDDDLREVIGLGWHVIAKFLPSGIGGGDLATAERELMGRVWFAWAKPHLQGESSPLVVAIIGSVQVFALRALAAKMVKDAAAVDKVAKALPDAIVAARDAVATGKQAKPPAKGGGLAEPVETAGRPARPVDVL